MISTKNINNLPNKELLQKICKAISVLDAIISQEWEYRYYSYNFKWAENEEFCEMRNGSGDQMLILFQKDGCVINGFTHELYDFEAELPSKSKLTKELPEKFNEFIFGEPVKTIGTTFCIWNNESEKWKIGDLENNYEDGSEEMLNIFDGNPQTYVDWATEYFEESYKESGIPLKTVTEIYEGKTLTKEMVLSIVDEIEDWKQLEEDMKEINYKFNFK